MESFGNSGKLCFPRVLPRVFLAQKAKLSGISKSFALCRFPKKEAYGKNHKTRYQRIFEIDYLLQVFMNSSLEIPQSSRMDFKVPISNSL